MQKIKDIDFFLPETLMIKESYHMIGQEHILVSHLKVYLIHNKKTQFFLEFN